MASASQAVVAHPFHRITGRGGLIDKYFYFTMSLLIVAIVISGFGQTVNANLLHPAVPRPGILWIHAVTFSTWVLFFVLQSALVRTHNVRLHRTLGWFGAGLGGFMIPLGLATAYVMTRFNVHQLHETFMMTFPGIQLNDMLSFTTFFLLAIYWRRKPELHRRSIFIATSALMAAAFGRFPYLARHNVFYLGVDAVILLGVMRDLLVNRRIHTIYRIALPIMVVLQATVVYLFLAAPAWWVRITSAVVG